MPPVISETTPPPKCQAQQGDGSKGQQLEGHGKDVEVRPPETETTQERGDGPRRGPASVPRAVVQRSTDLDLT